ncbi:MAG: MFS transporter [Deltaproteobacteria bacterium]|nr:MAG: MFS transporter [Deltaproteobacteria bacterium]
MAARPTGLASTHAAAAHGRSLPMGVKLAYAAPAFASAGLALPIFALMPKFYSDVVHVPLGYIAIAIALARAFDAITDPGMGWISDRTRSRFGRRRPWLALGAPLCALAVIALFAPPRALGPLGASLWFGVTFTLYFLFHTVYFVPYGALGYELTPDYNERSSLFGWREAFALTGTLSAGATPFILSEAFDDPRAGYVSIGLVFAVLLVGLFGWLVVRVRERPDFAHRDPNPLVPGVRRALRNRPFRIILLAYVVFSLTGAIPVTLAPYYITYVLRPANDGLWLTYVIAGYVFAGFVSIPFWIWAAKRFGKRRAWLISIWVGISGGTPIFFLGEGDMVPFLCLILFTGTGLGAGLLHGSMQADIIDYDELHTGRRREAQYASLWSIVPKFVAIPSAALPLAVLGSVGYVPNQPQEPEVLLAMRAMLGLAPASVGVIGFLIALRFPMTEAKHREILEGIEAHKRGEDAVDPLTNEVLPPVQGRRVDDRTGWFLDHFSRGELRRIVRRSAGRALFDVTTVGMLSLIFFLGASTWVFAQVRDVTREPGTGTTLGVVLAGFGLTAFVFHLLRLRSALRMRRDPVDRDVLCAHLEPSLGAVAGRREA